MPRTTPMFRLTPLSGVTLALTLAACGSVQNEQADPKRPAHAKSKPAAKVEHHAAAATKENDDNTCKAPTPAQVSQAIGKPIDARCAKLGDPGSRPCKADQDCPANMPGVQMEACVQGCCLLLCDASKACLWNQACKNVGANKNASGVPPGVCMSVSVEWPPQAETAQCDGYENDPACGATGKICAHRTKCDPWAQCGSIKCDDDRDCVTGGKCVEGLCKKGK